jgi:hypothetical protein
MRIKAKDYPSVPALHAAAQAIPEAVWQPDFKGNDQRRLLSFSSRPCPQDPVPVPVSYVLPVSYRPRRPHDASRPHVPGNLIAALTAVSKKIDRLDYSRYGYLNSRDIEVTLTPAISLVFLSLLSLAFIFFFLSHYLFFHPLVHRNPCCHTTAAGTYM